MKLLASTKSKITKGDNYENVPYLQIIWSSIYLEYYSLFGVVLVHCNIVKNNYQRDSKAFYTYIAKKSFDQLLDISHKNFISIKKNYFKVFIHSNVVY